MKHCFPNSTTLSCSRHLMEKTRRPLQESQVLTLLLILNKEVPLFSTYLHEKLLPAIKKTHCGTTLDDGQYPTELEKQLLRGHKPHRPIKNGIQLDSTQASRYDSQNSAHSEPPVCRCKTSAAWTKKFSAGPTVSTFSDFPH